MGYVCWVGIVETSVQHYVTPHETYNIAVELPALGRLCFCHSFGWFVARITVRVRMNSYKFVCIGLAVKQKTIYKSCL